MIPKIIHPDAFDFGMPTVALIDTYSKGFHMEALHKRAAQFDDSLNNITRKPGYTYLHLITTGAGEKYGPNNNGDYFNKQASVMSPFLEPYKSKMLKMAGGLTEYHNPTFMEFGKVYKNHMNRHKNGTPSGYIVKAAYNTDMDRGELIVGVDNDLWNKELQKVAQEQPIFFSMACDVKHDTCSACGNQASKLSEYCDHLKNDMLTITKEGHQVYAINDKPLFHDISGVFKPADKIAFALRKVASDRVLSSAEIASLHGLAPRVDIMRKYAGLKTSNRIELLSKLAAIEKEILASTSGEPMKDLMLPFTGCNGGIEEFDNSTVNVMKNQDPGALFGSLKNKMVVMPFETFLKIVTGNGFDQVADKVPSAKKMLPGVFGRMLEDTGVEAALEDGSYESSGSHGGQELESEISRLIGSHSLAASPVKGRVIKIAITGSPQELDGEMPKIASEINDAAADFLAKEYARYVVSFADGLPEDKLNLTVAQTIANSI